MPKTKTKTKFVAATLTMSMLVSSVVQPVFAYPFRDAGAGPTGSEIVDFVPEAEIATATERGGIQQLDAEHLGFLTSTMYAQPVERLSGFVNQYALPENPNQLVEIVVQFKTPPAVALRLLAENNQPASQRQGRMADVAFEAEALAAHARFSDQLSTMPMPLGVSQTPRITGTHHTLLNAMYMTVPAGMVKEISNLPEVFMVTPNFTWHTMDVPVANERNREPAGAQQGGGENLVSQGESIVAAAAYQAHPLFNAPAIELFDIEYIHANLATGAGVRMGIIDTGVDYRHPFFERYLVYIGELGRTWGAVTRNGRMYSLPGSNFMGGGAIPARPDVNGTGTTNRPHGPNTSPMENMAGAVANHGTHVAGTAVAMAPDVSLYAWRVLSAGSPNPGPAAAPNAVNWAIEEAYTKGLDVINLSLGNNVNTPWQPTSYALNLASLAGVTVVGAAGNDGQGHGDANMPIGGWFSMGGGVPTTSLAIVVGATIGGGMDIYIAGDSSVNGTPTEIALIGVSPNAINLGQNYDYVWFGRLDVSAVTPAFITNVRNTLLGGDDMTGRVMVMNRAAGSLVEMLRLAQELNAAAFIVINNEANNEHFVGGALSNPGVSIPVYSVRAFDGDAVFGVPTPVAAPISGITIGTGTLNFGTVAEATTAPEVLAAFSGVGPLGPVLGRDVGVSAPGGGISVSGRPDLNALMHIKPDILAPGVNIFSTNSIGHATPLVDGRAYTSMNGTSMSAHHIAGIAALMVQRFPSATPIEVKARLMNTSRPLNPIYYPGQYSVMQVGAGLVNPLAALTSDGWATAVHPIPTGGPAWSTTGPIDGTGTPGVMEYAQMASLSFGDIVVAEGSMAQTDVIPVTVHGGGTWTARYVLNMPTQTLPRPTGRPGWGPALTHTNTGVGVNIVTTSSNTFDIYITHDGLLENSGLAEGYIFLEGPGGQSLSMPFAAYFFIAPPAEPLQPHPNSLIWRPVISGFVNTPYNAGAEDPRSHPLNVGAGIWYPGDTGAITQSNYSTMTFGFIDPSPRSEARPARFYIGQYGDSFENKQHFFTTPYLAANATQHLWSQPIRTILGGEVWGIGVEDARIIEGGILLAPGVWTVTVHVEHGAGPAYDLFEEFHFIVTNDRPVLELDNDGVFEGQPGTSINITGRVTCQVQTQAIAMGLRTTGWPFAPRPLNYGDLLLQVGNSAFSTSPDGSFNLTAPTPATPYTTMSAFGGNLYSRYIDFSGSWVRWASSNRTETTPFTLVNAPFAAALTQLDYLIDYAEALVYSNFSERSWERLLAELEEARRIQGGQIAPLTLVRVETAVVALQVAIANLLPNVPVVDMTDLTAAISHAQGLEQGHFNRGSWLMMQQALAYAQYVAALADATPAHVAAAAASLWGAINNLVINVNFNLLNAAIAQAQAIQQDGLTDETWAILQEALWAALAVSTNANATQDEVDAAADALLQAVDGLEEVVEELAGIILIYLDEAIAKAEIVFQARPDINRFIRTEINSALAVRNNANATQNDVDTATANLLAFLNSL